MSPILLFSNAFLPLLISFLGRFESIMANLFKTRHHYFFLSIIMTAMLIRFFQRVLAACQWDAAMCEKMRQGALWLCTASGALCCAGSQPTCRHSSWCHCPGRPARSAVDRRRSRTFVVGVHIDFATPQCCRLVNGLSSHELTSESQS